jgi:negative regulator of sigma E activity
MDNYEKIEAYLQGELSDAERVQFQQELQADEALMAQFKTYQLADGFLQNEQRINAGEAALRNSINAIINQQKTTELQPAKLVTLKKRWLYTAVAAAACIAILVLLKPVIFTTDIDAQKLYSQNASFETFSANRGKTATDSLLRIGEKQFNKKQYPDAIAAFTQYLKSNPNEPKYQLARAFALIETGKYADAEMDLLAIQNGTSAYASMATWYRALSLLKQQKITDCKKILQTISSGDDMYKKAQELLSQLD